MIKALLAIVLIAFAPVWTTAAVFSCDGLLAGDSRLDCRHFNGYKPCGKSEICNSSCAHYSALGPRILLVHLGALGAVLRSTALVPAILRQYPGAAITWVTQSPAQILLMNNPDIQRVLTLDQESLLTLKNFEFDYAFVVDKSTVAAGLIKDLKVGQVRGFVTDSRNGAIVPANPEAIPLWELGLSDQKKFFENKKSEVELVHEALALGDYRRDEYQIFLSSEEKAESAVRRKLWSEDGKKLVVGINTGCANVLPAKKLSIEGQREIIKRMQSDPRFQNANIVLLGGKEDEERNRQIGKDLNVILSPTTAGLRDGLISTEATDVVLSGDSLGMHMAIALKKQVVAWFGPTVASEIEFYDRGEAVLTKAVCSPCWKRRCTEAVMCYDQVDYSEILDALGRGLNKVILNPKVRSKL